MLVAVRALTYSTLFIGFLLVFLPRQFLAMTGIVQPATLGAAQIAGMVVGAVGAALALWCIGTFVAMGKGTPAPFDPPQKLVIAGPYRFVRNPMYIGAAIALAGAALFYGSWWLLAYAAAFIAVTHLFVIVYEEPTLDATFGADYSSYRERVRRWLPGRG